jgi:hypothetical protein
MSNPFESIFGGFNPGSGRSREEMQHVADMFRKANTILEYRLVADALDWACGKTPEKFMQLKDMLAKIERATQ